MPDDGGGEETWQEWHHSWWLHVGAVPILWGGVLSPRWSHPLGEARLVWCDEIDALSDEQLLQFRGLGQKSLEKIREVLSAYYWRSDEDASRNLWTAVLGRLREELESPSAREWERERALHGIAFAERVLVEEGAPLADPTAPRMIP